MINTFKGILYFFKNIFVSKQNKFNEIMAVHYLILYALSN